MVKTQIYKKSLSPGKRKIIFIITMLILCTALIWGREGTIREFIIPGNPGITEAAFINLVTDLREGEKFGDAITTFCREIIDNNGINNA